MAPQLSLGIQETADVAALTFIMGQSNIYTWMGYYWCKQKDVESHSRGIYFCPTYGREESYHFCYSAQANLFLPHEPWIIIPREGPGIVEKGR